MSWLDTDQALELPRDEDGRVVGFGVGKEAAMRDWLHRKEEREFAKLVVRLRARKWQQEHPERARENKRRWDKAHPEVTREKTRRARARRYQAQPKIHTCPWCGATWCKVPWLRRSSEFCSRSCRGKSLYHGKKVSR